MHVESASDGLTEIADAARAAKQLRAYENLGPIVSMWGAVWLAGFGTQQAAPAFAPLAWLVGWIVGVGWSATRPRRPGEARAFASWCVVIAFVALFLWAIQATLPVAALTSGLALATAYALFGIWIGRRFFVLSALVLMPTCVGWWLTPEWMFGLLALGGGAGLLIGGRWLARP